MNDSVVPLLSSLSLSLGRGLPPLREAAARRVGRRAAAATSFQAPAGPQTVRRVSSAGECLERCWAVVGQIEKMEKICIGRSGRPLGGLFGEFGGEKMRQSGARLRVFPIWLVRFLTQAPGNQCRRSARVSAERMRERAHKQRQTRARNAPA